MGSLGLVLLGLVGILPLVGSLNGYSRDQGAYRELDAYLFQKKPGMVTDAALVWVDGELVYERYQAPTNAQTKHLTWSVSKSILSLLVGVLERQGKIDINKSVCDYIKAPREKCGIKVKDALEMSSGLGWRETYEGSFNPATSSVLQMLYGKGRAAMAAWALGHSEANAPGTTVYYSSGDSMVVSQIVKAILGSQQTDFIKQNFFDPLNINEWTWEQDGQGAIVGSSYLYLSARSLGNVGDMILRGGKTPSGQTLVSSDWLQDSFQPAVGYQNSPPPAGEVVAGRHWWLNVKLNKKQAWPSAPQDTVAALGHWGQSLTVIPSAKIVAVRFANDRGASFSADKYLSLILKGAGR